jgi:hypothetical protein
MKIQAKLVSVVGVAVVALHVSRGDPKEGALFYEESPGKFDLKPVDKK